jgi:hypothetical protein
MDIVDMPARRCGVDKHTAGAIEHHQADAGAGGAIEVGI